ncbi:MAG: hypothetical protein R3F24_11850 [Gammaproteobacteria bacterium]
MTCRGIVGDARTVLKVEEIEARFMGLDLQSRIVSLSVRLEGCPGRSAGCVRATRAKDPVAAQRLRELLKERISNASDS